MIGTVINLDSRPDRLSKFRSINKFPFEVDRMPAKVSDNGEDGCTWSHIAAMNRNYFPFVVFEDDCVMIEPWSTVEKCMAELPHDWDALWLGATLTQRLDRYSPHLFRLKKAYCLHAVIYSSRRMINFVMNNHKTPSGVNLDIFFFNHVMEKFNCFITDPICATQSESYSDIALKQSGSWIIEHSYHKYTK